GRNLPAPADGLRRRVLGRHEHATRHRGRVRWPQDRGCIVRNDHLSRWESDCRTETVSVDPAGGPAARARFRQCRAEGEARLARVPGANPASACDTARRHADSYLDTRHPTGFCYGGYRGRVCLRSGTNHRLSGAMNAFRYTIVFGALGLLLLFLLYP